MPKAGCWFCLIAFAGWMAVPNAATGDEKVMVTDAAIAAVLRAGEAWDTMRAQNLRTMGVERADRLAVFLKDSRLQTSALVAISYWPDKQTLEPTTTNELLKLAEDSKFEERQVAYSVYLTSIPLSRQIPEAKRILKIGQAVEVKAVLGYCIRLSNNEKRRAELELSEVQSLLRQVFEETERLLPEKYNLDLLSSVTREPFNSHPQYRNRVAQLLFKLLDRFVYSKSRIDEGLGDHMYFLICISKADPKIIKDGLVDFFLRQNDAASQGALRVTYVVLEARDLKDNPLWKDVVDELPRRQPRFEALLKGARTTK